MNESAGDSVSNVTAVCPRGKWTLRDSALLAALLLLALAVRIIHIDPFPSLDEIWHMGLTAGYGSPMSQFLHGQVSVNPPSWSRLESTRPFWTVWTHMDGVLHPPLYCLTLRLWRDALGASDLAAHLYSIFWCLITLGFLYDTARRSMDRTVAALIVLAMGMSQSQVYFAQEIRGYAMMIGIATVALWLMTRVEVEGATRRRVAVLAWITLPLMLTHYFAAGGALAVCLWGLFRLKGQRLRFALHVAGAAIAYLAIWLPQALKQVDDIYTGDAFVLVEHLALKRVALALTSAPIRMIADRNYKISLFYCISGLLLVLPWIQIRRFRPLAAWGAFLCGGLFPLMALDVLRSTIQLEYLRYFSIITPAVFLLVAGVAWSWSKTAAYALSVVATFLGGYHLVMGTRMLTNEPNLIAQAQALNGHLRSGEALIAFHGTGSADLGDMAIMTTLHQRQWQDRPVLILSQPMSAEARAAMTKRAWLITFNLFDAPGLRGKPDPVGMLTAGGVALPDSFRDDDGFQYIHIEWKDPATQPAS